ncbi:C25 family cysteine peptidase [[Eubacterium] cellulosolvens]
MVESDDSTGFLRNQLLTFAVIVILLLTGVYIIYPETSSETTVPFVMHSNTKQLISNNYFVELDVEGDDAEPWQYAAAVAFVPMVMGEKVLGGDELRSLVFSTTPAKPRSLIKYPNLESIKLSDLGDSANDVSIAIATEYWTNIKTVIIVSDYENALLVAPLAKLLDFPIIIDGKHTSSFIKDQDVESAITVGRVKGYDEIGIKHLSTREALWKFYLEKIDQNGEKCEYIVVTNPEDINHNDPRLYIPGLSLASSVLASGRNALVVTADYTVDIESLRKIGFGLGDAGSGERGNIEDNITDNEEEELQREINRRAVRVDNDIDAASDFLLMHEHTPHYVALVGGPAAVPMMYIKSPIWYEDVDQEEKGEEYVATDMFYGDQDIDLGDDNDQVMNYYYSHDDIYEQELAVGRIVAQDIGDASALVARSLGYWNFEFEDPSILEIDHWTKRSLIVTSLMTGDSDNMAANHQQEKFLENRMYAEEYSPDRIAATNNVNGLDVKDQMEKVNGIIFDGHGYPDGWYHMWTTSGDEDADWDRIGAEDINELTLHAVPVFGACCLSSALDWPSVGTGGSHEKEMTPENCMSLAFIKAGAMCYIGATEESWGAFFGGLIDEDPDAWGYGDFDLPTMFWHYLLNNNLEIGVALNKAKEEFLDEIWTDQASKPFAHLCMLETVLYGDPAAQNGHPGFSK